jgi:hypothetical protein
MRVYKIKWVDIPVIVWDVHWTDFGSGGSGMSIIAHARIRETDPLALAELTPLTERAAGGEAVS